MRKPSSAIAYAWLAAGLLSSAAMAADPQYTATFEALDKNADRQISKAEAQADRKLADGFASADSNGDGYLNKTEYQAQDAPKDSES
jgi:hypothetical protein